MEEVDARSVPAVQMLPGWNLRGRDHERAQLGLSRVRRSQRCGARCPGNHRRFRFLLHHRSSPCRLR